jgi:hypothetical protein
MIGNGVALALALALALVASVGGIAGCGQVKLGSFSDAGPGRKPAAAIAWEPTSEEAHQAITAIHYGKQYTLVGFTDGEIYWSRVGPTPSWSRLDRSTQANVRSLPHRPVSAFLVDEESGLSHLGVGYIGAPTHTIWVRLDATSDWYDTGPPQTAEDVLAFSRSPFDARHVLAVTTSGVITSNDGGMTWGGAWPDLNFPGAVSAIAEGRSPNGLRRAWLGDGQGGVHYADANPDSTWPARPTWTRLANVVFPPRMVSAISVNPSEPAEIWVSFKSLDGWGASLWRTSDYGQDWVNADNPRLPGISANVANSGMGAVAVDSDPTRRITYTTAIVSATPAAGSVIGHWSVDSGRSWYVNTGVR